MSDEKLRRLAEELAMRIHLGEVNAGEYRGANTYRQVLTDEILKVATEAEREERERIEGIVRGFAHNEHEVPTNHVVLEILGHIEGGKR